MSEPPRPVGPGPQGELVLRPGRAGIYASAAAALVFGAIGIGMLLSGRLTGLIVVAIGAVGLFAFLAGVIPGAAYLRLDDQGFFVKAPTKSWGAGWGEIERFRVEAIRVGRFNQTMDVVRADYRDGYEQLHAATSKLAEMPGIDEHYVMPGYGGLRAGALMALLEEWRSSHGGPIRAASIPEA
ncbi:MAG TPA: hypothetical protein VGM80_00655 [Gaiellaceae bacterium]